MNAENLSKVGSRLVKRCGTRDPFSIARQLGIEVMFCLKLFDTAPEMDLMRLVFNQLQDRLIEIDVDFISELGFLYLNILSLSLLRNFQMP